jgi:tRNA pseudouridine55 synthase
MERIRPRSPLIEGVLPVDKGAGLTSHDVIARARRVLGVRRIGHMGTLDPFATGLLVLLVGRVTRLASYLQGEPKVYDATIRFGTRTDTDDSTGQVIETAAMPAPSTVEAMIPRLTGTLEQMPPAYSAKQVDGVRAYDAARRGAPLELRTSTVTVHEWQIRGWRTEHELDVTVTCAGGTYIRALARDLGVLSGSLAHLSSLRRTRSGPFRIEDAIPVDALAPGVPLRPALDGLTNLPAFAVSSEQRSRVARGQVIVAEPPGNAPTSGDRAVLLDGDRHILAIAERQAAGWAPRVVLIDG